MGELFMNNIINNSITVNGLPKVGTINQAAADFSLSPYTIRTWVRSGALPAVHSGRKIFINYGVLAAFLEGSCLQNELEAPTPKHTTYVPEKRSKGNQMPPIF